MVGAGAAVRDVGSASDLVIRSLGVARERNVVVMVPIGHWALGRYREMGMTYWLERAEAEVTELERDGAQPRPRN